MVYCYEVVSVLYEQKSQIQVYFNFVVDGVIYVEYKFVWFGLVIIEWINVLGQILLREVKELEVGD